MSYTASNSAGALKINGAVVTEWTCCDIPNEFRHTNVVAVFIGSAPLVMDHVERDENSLRFHFSGEPPYDYTVEYAQSPAATNWLPLASYRAKVAPIDIVVTDSFTNAPARFFRVRKEPCGCR